MASDPIASELGAVLLVMLACSVEQFKKRR
jgi:hypothetical protein